ncbi:hypothetical protein RHS02_06876, partial [Rhizoctonia solani]
MESLPTEMLTECLSYLEPHDLLRVLSVSKILRGAASHDTLWQPHCERIYNKGSHDVLGWRKAEKFNGFAYRLIWRRLALVEPYLGWWLSLDKHPNGSIIRIWVDNLTLMVSSVTPIVRHQDPNSQMSTLTDSMGYIFAATRRRGLRSPLCIEANYPYLEQRLTKQSIQWLNENPSKILHRAHRLQTFHTSNKLRVNIEPKSTHFKWPFCNSPSLVNAIKHGEVIYDEENYAIVESVPTLSYPAELASKLLVAIHSPFEESDCASLIAGGTWAASYGDFRGCELIHIQVRKIDERDLNGQWGDEGNLADAVTPFAQDIQRLFMLSILPAPFFSSDDVQIGNTIIEAIKITGDTNVPRGVRTFVGFLDHKEVWSGPSENGDFVPRPSSHPWPLLPGSTIDIHNQVPADALPADISEMRTQDVPFRGITIPGLMRVADTGFSDPKWANAVIHVVNRREIRVMLLEGHRVRTFYKVQQSMFKSMD